MGDHTENDSLDPLSQLVLECLERMESGGPGALEDFLAEHPDQSEAIRRRVEPLARAGLLDTGSTEVPDRLGDFRLLDPLGGGGMGIVYRARQESLGREVALKLIRPDQLAFPDARARFRREVEVVAKLQHPGIVPVYAFGEEQGTPFLAMERVVGATLAEVLSELRGRDPAALSGRDLAAGLRAALDRRGGVSVELAPAAVFEGDWPSACARLLVQVARAVEHAHGNGVLHRDLKPSNVLLTVDGRALLFDFGLSSSDWVGKLTRSGSVLGSLPYMAPEQVGGGSADRRTDVYGLGVTLYELLCLRSPFEGAGAVELHQRILNGKLPPIRARNPAVPRDLDVVTCTALERDSARRYATAAAFADDLENSLTLRPITARPAGAALRLRRWAQRNPARAIALLLGVLLVVGGPTGFAIQRGIANQRLGEMVTKAEAERARAEGNLDQAVEAIVDLVRRVGHVSLDGVPGIDGVRASILADALERMEALTPQLSEDSDALMSRAQLYRNMAEVCVILDRPEEALAAFEESIEAYRALSGLGDGVAVDWALGAVYNGYANELARFGRTDEVSQAIDRALEHLERGRERAPEEVGVASDLAMVLRHRGARFLQRGETEEARPFLERALAALEPLLEADPDDWRLRTEFSFVLTDLSALESRYGDLERGAALEARARALLEAQVAERPDEYLPRESLIGLLIASSGQPTDRASLARCEADARRGLVLVGELVEARPYDLRMQRSQLLLTMNLGLMLGYQDRNEDALAVQREAIDTARALHARTGTRDDLDTVARTLLTHAVYLEDLARYEEALAVNSESLAIWDQVLAEDPENSQYRYIRGRVGLDNAECRLRVGERVDLEAVDVEAREYLGDDFNVDYALASMHGLTGDLDRAFEYLDQALDAGYQLGGYMEEAEDLAALVADPRWAELVAGDL